MSENKVSLVSAEVTTGYNTEAERWASVLGGRVTDHTNGRSER